MNTQAINTSNNQIGKELMTHNTSKQHQSMQHDLSQE